MKITEARRRATKKYINKKINEGWVWMNVFVPYITKEKLMKYKHDLMKEYYGNKTNN